MNADALVKDRAAQLTTVHLLLLAQAINSFGDGDHPMAEMQTVQHFRLRYALRCLERADDATEDCDPRKREIAAIVKALQS